MELAWQGTRIVGRATCRSFMRGKASRALPCEAWQDERYVLWPTPYGRSSATGLPSCVRAASASSTVRLWERGRQSREAIVLEGVPGFPRNSPAPPATVLAPFRVGSMAENDAGVGVDRADVRRCKSIVRLGHPGGM